VSRPRTTRRGDGARVRVTVSLSPDEADALTRAAGGERNRADYMRRVALDRAASYAAHLPGVMAEAEGVELGRPLVMAVGEERSCFTCTWDRPGVCGVHGCVTACPDVAGVHAYISESGCEDTPDAMPTNRTLACPGWAPKENP
jgi:hypothetical protein